MMYLLNLNILHPAVCGYIKDQKEWVYNVSYNYKFMWNWYNTVLLISKIPHSMYDSILKQKSFPSPTKTNSLPFYEGDTGTNFTHSPLATIRLTAIADVQLCQNNFRISIHKQNENVTYLLQYIMYLSMSKLLRWILRQFWFRGSQNLLISHF